MKLENNALDEMQKEKRNNIGHQMFMLLFYALLLDTGLQSAGLHWLKYPANIMVILMVCMGVYLIRTIAANAYLPPKAQARSTGASVGLALAFAAVLAFAGYALFGSRFHQPVVADSSDNSALILLIVSVVGLVLSLVAAIIRRAANRRDDE